jgi:transcription elongation factor SPT5
VIKVDRELLHVLDQNSSARTVLPSQVSNKIEERRHAVATDSNGSDLSVGDTVREAGGNGRTGKVIHIHRAFIFAHSHERTENAGVFVARAVNTTTVAAKAGRLTGNNMAAPDLSRMNPAAQRNGSMFPPPVPAQSFGRDRLIGKTVNIRKGANKGLLGIVRSTTATDAQVELHARNIMILVPKDILGIKEYVTDEACSFLCLHAWLPLPSSLPLKRRFRQIFFYEIGRYNTLTLPSCDI